MRGRFITFEGGEGTGKSTHAARLAERLKTFGVGVHLTREPGGSPGAEIMRYVILSGVAKPLGAEAEAMLFAAARDDHLNTVIRPALERGVWVICDRFAELDPHLSRRRRRRRFTFDPRDGAHRGRRHQARPDFHPGRAGEGRNAARRPSAAATPAPTVSKTRRWRSMKSCATASSCLRRASRSVAC